MKMPFLFAHILAMMLSALFIFSAHAYAKDSQDCQGCHTNPVYKKEDAERLKECLTCHGTAGHPYRKSTLTLSLPLKGGGKKGGESGSVTPKSDLSRMILIPEGEFIMGTDVRLKDEKPSYVVYLDAFYIDRFEVTHEDYKKFVEGAGHPPPDNWENANYPQGKGRHPVVFVDWNDASEYCKWLGKRLPREAEWEKGARGTDGRTYPWGEVWAANKSNNPFGGHEDTMTVGSFEEGKSPYGLYDMSGNVWEWVDDYYLPHPGSDFVSPEFGTKYRLLKGGSWMNCMYYSCGISAPVYNRAFFDSSTKNNSLGFRCAKGVD